MRADERDSLMNGPPERCMASNEGICVQSSKLRGPEESIDLAGEIRWMNLANRTEDAHNARERVDLARDNTGIQRSGAFCRCQPRRRVGAAESGVRGCSLAWWRRWGAPLRFDAGPKTYPPSQTSRDKGRGSRARQTEQGEGDSLLQPATYDTGRCARNRGLQ